MNYLEEGRARLRQDQDEIIIATVKHKVALRQMQEGSGKDTSEIDEWLKRVESNEPDVLQEILDDHYARSGVRYLLVK